ncbi:C40 family peptidase [Weissella diestrammenae]|uniref:C40 family peptidase n=1 Tax=Weissella diestrammenae TaxID=1162633 RepID=A0A7G9T555_9LACO|nr:NlpC/P60 family protein [Weissella diestrammenae]MCM0583086.1 C40 family peptidase [Weissella diestrammenae]QNN75230.1 C40 family peptidase [Weissella diestrammenae]
MQASRLSKHRKRHINRWIIRVTVTIVLIVGGAFWLKTHEVDAQPNLQYFTLDGNKVKIQVIQGSRYLINVKTKQKIYGLQTLNKKQYYFDPKTGKMQFGLQSIDGYYYYFKKNGVEDEQLAYQKVSAQLVSQNSTIESVIKKGSQLIGKSEYHYGGGRTSDSIAKNEFDCSSFVAWFYRKAGQPLVYQYAASTSLLAQTGEGVTWNEKQRGDLLVTPDEYDVDRQHVAIYLGGGFILHDANATNGVAISRLNDVINLKTSTTLTWAGLFEPGTVRREINE